MAASWSGSLRIGLTTMAISDTTSPAQVPSSADQITSKITWIVSGTTVQKCGALIKDNYAPALERLQVRSVLLSFDGLVFAHCHFNQQYERIMIIMLYIYIDLYSSLIMSIYLYKQMYHTNVK